MSDRRGRFDATHVVVIHTSADGDREVRATNAALAAVLDAADTVTLDVSLTALADDHPETAAELEAVCERTADGRLRGTPEAVREPLSNLLALTSVHRFTTLSGLDAFVGGEQILRYIPDHRTFRLNADPTPDLAERVRAALADQPAGLLPAEELVGWTTDGTRCSLAPPSLCVGETCVRLTRLVGVTLDHSAGEILLDWSRPDGLLGRAVAVVSSAPPETFQFDDDETFSAVADAFETVGQALEIPVRER